MKIKIEVGVYGVEEGENRYIQLDEDPIDEIEKLSRDVETQTINEQVVAEAPEEIHDVEKLQEKIYETKEKEEKVDDDEDLGVYYLYVVLPNDTYASIARQYQVDEKMIRDYNQDLNLDGRTNPLLFLMLQKIIQTKYDLDVIGLIQISPRVYKVKTANHFYCVKIVDERTRSCLSTS